MADVRGCYSPRNVAWQVLAVALTWVSVVSGFDWWWFTHTRDPLLQSWLFPAAIIGGVLPIVLPIIFWLVGRYGKDARARIAAFAVAKAAILALFISSFYKSFTGRIPPPFHSSSLVDSYKVFTGQVLPPFHPSSVVDISRQFEFGFLRDGVFWGWPSSHTTVAFAVAVALAILYRDNRFVRYGALLVALYIGIGVSTNIHWFSEFIAGMIIGSVVGAVVGTNARARAASFALFAKEGK